MLRHELDVWAPGVYATEGGRLTWIQRAWGAVLACAPAVLDLDSALRAECGPGWRGRDDEAPIQVAIADSRSCTLTHPEIDVRRVAGLAGRALWNRHPARMRVEESALDAAIRSTSKLDRIEVLARAVRSRMTTTTRLRDALAKRSKAPGRAGLEMLLADIGEGTHSVLEHGYLVHVERPHGLPRAIRQQRDSGVYRDVSYEPYDTIIELDGRLDHHDVAQRAGDLARDLDAAARGRRTTRLGWAQVFSTPCHTANIVGGLLQYAGWQGRPVPCGDACAVRQPA